MKHAPLVRLALVTLGSTSLVGAARAQCVDWASGFTPAGVANAPADQVVFDDGSGSGPELFLGGSLAIAGDVAAQSVAKWNGTRWTAIPSALSYAGYVPHVNALAVFDDGGGPALYAGGLFTSIDGVAANDVAKWNGTSWSALASGTNNLVLDLAVFDDGTGDALYVAGSITTAGGVQVHGIAKWNGSAWSSIASSITDPANGFVRTLAVADDGGGPALFASGRFTAIDGVSAHHIAKWNGTTWSALGPGLSDEAFALAEYDDGTGPALFAGGSFSYSGGVQINRVAMWRNGAWSQLGGGLYQYVYELAVYDDGAGEQLYVGGQITSAGGTAWTYGLARWNGTSWSKPTNGSGLAGTSGSMATYDDGNGMGLYVTGQFETADGLPAQRIARLDSGGWEPLGTSNAPGGAVSALHAFDDGSGSSLYVGGNFTTVGPLVADSIARFDGSSWSRVGSGANCDGIVQALADFDDGSGSALYAGGTFTNLDGISVKGIAKFDGTSWSALGNGIGNAAQQSAVNALLVHDDGSGPALYVAGGFVLAGGNTARRIARWDGTTWSTLGTGFDASVFALATFDDGSGPKLFAGGTFQHAGGNVALGIARWDGVTWSGVGSGTNNDVNALAVFDDGSGPALFAAGSFTSAGGVGVSSIAKWNGSTWSGVGGGIHGTPAALEVFDDGGGAALYVSGSLVTAGGASVQNIARWNGAQWSALGAGLGGYNFTELAVFDAGNGPALFVGGAITSAGGKPSFNIAEWSRACGCAPVSYCTAGTSSNGCVPSIGAVGTASASGSGSFVVTASGVEGQKLGLLFYGMSGATSSPWGMSTSTLCVKPPQQRTGQTSSGGTSGLCDGALVLDFNAYVASHPTSLGQPFAVGDTVRMQGWYRDPPNPKTTSLTNALEFYACP